jgi:hypothetical protein
MQQTWNCETAFTDFRHLCDFAETSGLIQSVGALSLREAQGQSLHYISNRIAHNVLSVLEGRMCGRGVATWEVGTKPTWYLHTWHGKQGPNLLGVRYLHDMGSWSARSTQDKLCQDPSRRVPRAKASWRWKCMCTSFCSVHSMSHCP